MKLSKYELKSAAAAIATTRRATPEVLITYLKFTPTKADLYLKHLVSAGVLGRSLDGYLFVKAKSAETAENLAFDYAAILQEDEAAKSELKTIQAKRANSAKKQSA